MFGISGNELILILLVALLIFGPGKLPELARLIGKATGEFNRARMDLQREINLAGAAKPAAPQSAADAQAAAAEANQPSEPEA
jgi:TatA/E family protein of Tat protein translocase